MTASTGGGSTTMQLPPVLDLKAAEGLLQQLRAVRGQPITIDASQVQRLGGLCLQVLLSARSTWDADGHVLQLAKPSDAFSENLKLFGAEQLFDLGETI